MIGSNRNSWRSIILAALLILSAASDAGAIDVAVRQDPQNTLEFQGSFSFARRETFRDLYGNGVAFGLRFEHIINDRISWGVRLSRVQLAEGEYNFWEVDLGYRDLSLAPMINYTFTRTGLLRLFSGAGLGLSFRKITLVGTAEYYAFEADQTEMALYGVLMLGADLGLSRSVYLGARVSYDRHLFSGAKTGNLGDSGGFNFGGCFGFGL